MQHLKAILDQSAIDTMSLTLVFERTNEPFYSLAVPGATAELLWHQLRALGDSLGCWPLICGDTTAYHNLIEQLQLDNTESTTAILQRAQVIRPRQWFLERSGQPTYPDEQWFVDYRTHVYADMTAYLQDQGLMDEVGETDPWSDNVLDPDWNRFAIPFANLHPPEPHPTVYIMLLPTRRSWYVPALLRYEPGEQMLNRRTTPDVAAHVAIMYYWSKHYDAEITGIADMTIEMRATRPPQNQISALTLAWEHATYAPAMEGDDTPFFEPHAAALLRGGVWRFSFDM